MRPWPRSASRSSGAPTRSDSRVDYVAMLEATGTGTPAELLAGCGLDVGNPDVWEQSLSELERLCELAW